MKSVSTVRREKKKLEDEFCTVPTVSARVRDQECYSAGYLLGVKHVLNWTLSDGPASPAETWHKFFAPKGKKVG